MAWGILLLAASLAYAARDAESTDEAGPLPGGDWPMERVVLVDGKVYRGLVAAETESSVEFVEVRRLRGKPMFLVVRSLDRESIASLKRLEPEQQQALRTRLEKFKYRSRIESRQMEGLVLGALEHDGLKFWSYEGPCFFLESTADEPMTRRLIVRLEQLFTAYRQLLPPRPGDSQRVRIRIYGSTGQYLAALREVGWEIRNPAVFLADKNLMLAGSEINRFSDELSQVNRQHRQIKQELDVLAAEIPARLKRLGEELQENQVPPAERARIVQAEQKKWDDQRKAAERKIAVLDRKNAAKFNEVTGRMFARLAHEAFHVYLETSVYPRQNFNVPRWLNEGLAQTFEAGFLEADTLRIDMPNRAALARLQADLRGANPLSLKEVLLARSETFLSVHHGQATSRAYDYSWGLAYYLAFERGLLGTSELETYLSSDASGKSAVERFEQWVGMPLAEFEARWREAMLGLDAN